MSRECTNSRTPQGARRDFGGDATGLTVARKCSTATFLINTSLHFHHVAGLKTGGRSRLNVMHHSDKVDRLYDLAQGIAALSLKEKSPL